MDTGSSIVSPASISSSNSSIISRSSSSSSSSSSSGVIIGDTTNSGKSSGDSFMILNSAIVVILLTMSFMEKVNNSIDNYRKDILVAFQHRKPDHIITVALEPMVLNKQYWPDGLAKMELFHFPLIDCSTRDMIEINGRQITSEISVRCEPLWLPRGAIVHLIDVSSIRHLSTRNGGFRRLSNSSSSSSNIEGINSLCSGLRHNNVRDLKSLNVEQLALLLEPYKCSHTIRSEKIDGNLICYVQSVEDLIDLKFDLKSIFLRRLLDSIIRVKIDGVDLDANNWGSYSSDGLGFASALGDTGTGIGMSGSNSSSRSSTVGLPTDDAPISAPEFTFIMPPPTLGLAGGRFDYIPFLNSLQYDKYFLSPNDSANKQKNVVSRLTLLVDIQRGNRSFNIDLSEHGGCVLVVAALQNFNHRSGEDVVEKLLQVARFLSRYGETLNTSLDTNIKRLSKAGVCEVVTSSLSLFIHSEAVVAQVCKVITNLTKEDEQNRVKFGQTDMCVLINTALCDFYLNTNLCIDILEAIGNLAYRSSENMIKLGNCIEVLLEIISSNTTDNSSYLRLKQALLAVGTLADHAENNRQLGHRGACELVVRTMINFKSSSIIVQWACYAIAKLARNDKNSDKIGACNGSGALLRALQNHKESDQISERVCKALAYLTENNTKNCHELIGCDFCRVALDVLTVHHETVVILEPAINTLNNIITCGAVSQELLKRLGYVEIIDEMLKIHTNSSNTSFLNSVEEISQFLNDII